jgi:hypothetical protein
VGVVDIIKKRPLVFGSIVTFIFIFFLAFLYALDKFTILANNTPKLGLERAELMSFFVICTIIFIQGLVNFTSFILKE